jgi:hypothetical protein
LATEVKRLKCVWHTKCSFRNVNAARLRCVVDADFEEVGEQRRADRRQSDRRGARVRLDTGFAATLVNHIAKPEKTLTTGYAAAPKGPRAGIAFNLST